MSAAPLGSATNTFRSDGISIGQDFLRFEGKTLTRGEILADRLQLREIAGRGAFSTVQRAVWKKKRKRSDDDGKDDGNARNNHSETQCTKNATATQSTSVDGSSVAVKKFSLMHLTSQRKQMLVKELRALCSLGNTCPTLVTLHGACMENDTVTVVLEYMNRGSLQDFIGNAPTKHLMSEALLSGIAYQMLNGLAYLHHHGTCHRDLKPANVLLHSNGAVKLCDFGLASAVCIDNEESASALHTSVLGTTRYMAPERLRARPYGRRSDVWSFGLVLWVCRFGSLPWTGVTSIVDLVITVEEMNFTDALSEHVENTGGLSEGLKELLFLCLQHNPAKRMPAKVQLQSPWFPTQHNIHKLEHAVQKCRQLLPNFPTGP